MLRRLLRRVRPSQALPVLPSQAAYALWAQRYPAEAHNLLMQAEERAMRELLPPVQGLSLLDLGCGTGRWGRIALEGGAALVLGTDNSWPMVAQATMLQRAQADLAAIPLPAACVDGVLCGLAIGHTNRLRPTLAEIGRVLRPHGWALLSDFHPFQALRGAQRSFMAPDGRAYAVEHHVHLLSDVQQVAQAAGLHLQGLREPRYENWPIVVVYALQKGAGG